jgi:hypothetical protein
MPEFVTLKELSVKLGVDRSYARKYVINAGYDFLKVRTSESRQQLTLALTPEDAESVLTLRQDSGFVIGGNGVVIINDVGCFYIIKLIPEISSTRIKVGFATNIQTRLGAHRTVAPTAEIVKTWPCHRSWEFTVIASVTRVGCILIKNEVYDCDDIDGLIDRCDRIFSLMPSP